jgi:alkaline phosphatase D
LRNSSIFAHGVASGDPLSDRVMIWTRVSSNHESVPVKWRIARDSELHEVIGSGEVDAQQARDHCVHVDVAGLDPGHVYYYGFSTMGEDSPVGRTRTLRKAGGRLRFAICSCAKFNAGYFNAYARIAERDDLDFLLHLGDYIYEAGNVPAKGQTPGADIGRPFEPLGECRTLEEYRSRYAQYHRDPDVQRLHHALPIIPLLDDHELADGAWAGGSDAHDPDEHGQWSARREAALQARWEWLPARPPNPEDPSQVFRQVQAGDLADFFLLDIRSRRDQPTVGRQMDDPNRSMLGEEQRQWLLSALEESGAAWRLVATPSVFTRTWREDADERLKNALLKLKLMDEDGEGPDEDQWDGYPAERTALIEKFRSLDDVVVLSADIHVSIASEITVDGTPVASEITAPSLTSQNLDEKLGVEPRSEPILGSEEAFVSAFDHVHWCEFAGHGYVIVDVSEARVRAEWWHVDGVLERVPGEHRAAAFEASRGSSRLAARR